MAGERAVVVGAGGISGAWFPPLKAEGVNIMAVVDLDIDAARRRIAEFELAARPSSDLAGTLSELQPDFVVDLTVPEAHCAVTCTALEAGCHVIGEKPMAASMDEARQMVAASERTGRLYMVSQSRRWSAMHYLVRDVARSGEIGDITTMNCDFYIGAHFGGFRDDMPSPLVLDMSIHHFDLVRFFSGTDPVAVYAKEFDPKGSWYKGDVAASCIFEMSGGVVFTYRGSWCAEGCHTSWNGDWRLVGDRGTVIFEKDRPPYGQTLAGDTGFHRPLRDVVVPHPQPRAEGMHGGLLEMLDYLREGTVPQTECHDNIRSLAMVFAAIESAKLGQRVAIAS